MEKEQNETGFKVVEIPTEHRQVIVDEKGEHEYSIMQMLCKIVNDVEYIKKELR